MPTYEYECRKCGYQFDRFQSITAAPLKTCPKCHGRVHRMLTTGSGIIFKGSGFYETDYKHQHASVETPPAGDAASGKPAAETKTGDGAKPEAASAKGKGRKKES